MVAARTPRPPHHHPDILLRGAAQADAEQDRGIPGASALKLGDEIVDAAVAAVGRPLGAIQTYGFQGASMLAFRKWRPSVSSGTRTKTRRTSGSMASPSQARSWRSRIQAA